MKGGVPRVNSMITRLCSEAEGGNGGGRKRRTEF